MKKVILFTIAILFAWVTSAQTTFTVPERTAEKQYPRVVWVFNYNLTVAINYAKSMGQTAEDYGRYCGDIYKLTWPKGGELKTFVEGNIMNMTDFSDKVEIVSQSENKVVLKVYNLFDYLKEKGSDQNVTYEEFIQFFQSSQNQIADYLGCSIVYNIVNDGVEVIMEEKEHQVTMGIFTSYFYQPQIVKGWVKQINYQTFKGKEVNRKIEKGDPLDMSENTDMERYKSSYFFNKKGELLRIIYIDDKENNTWVRMLDYENGRIAKTFMMKNNIPESKSEMLYKGKQHLGSNWYNLETNNLETSAKLKYDENGFILNRILYNSKGEITTLGPKYIRDKDGLALERSLLKKDGSVSWQIKYQYDEHGLPVNLHRSIAKGEIVNENFKREYEFDENGNWIKQIQFGPPSGEIFIIERSFEFYKKRVEIELPESTLEMYVGKYELYPNFFVTITKKNKKMYAQGTDQEKNEIAAFDKNKFFTKEFTAEFIFHLNNKNKIIGFTLVQNGEYEAKKVE